MGQILLKESDIQEPSDCHNMESWAGELDAGVDGNGQD